MSDARTIGAMLRCIDGLTLYAIQRQQNCGIESGNQEARNELARELVCGLTSFYGLPEGISKAFDSRLEAAHGYRASETAGIQEQRSVVTGLSHFAADLEQAGSDPRPRLLQILDLFDDIEQYCSWDVNIIGLNEAQNRLNVILNRLTALQDIVFTHIHLSGEDGPTLSDFEGGVRINAESIADTFLFDDMREQYPEITEWTARCTVWQAGYGKGTPMPATEMDLDIMRRAGDDFLKWEGIVARSDTIEITVKAWPGLEQGPIMKL